MERGRKKNDELKPFAHIDKTLADRFLKTLQSAGTDEKKVSQLVREVKTLPNLSPQEATAAILYMQDSAFAAHKKYYDHVTEAGNGTASADSLYRKAKLYSNLAAIVGENRSDVHDFLATGTHTNVTGKELKEKIANLVEDGVMKPAPDATPEVVKSFLDTTYPARKAELSPVRIAYEPASAEVASVRKMTPARMAATVLGVTVATGAMMQPAAADESYVIEPLSDSIASPSSPEIFSAKESIAIAPQEVENIPIPAPQAETYTNEQGVDQRAGQPLAVAEPTLSATPSPEVSTAPSVEPSPEASAAPAVPDAAEARSTATPSVTESVAPNMSAPNEASSVETSDRSESSKLSDVLAEPSQEISSPVQSDQSERPDTSVTSQEPTEAARPNVSKVVEPTDDESAGVQSQGPEVGNDTAIGFVVVEDAASEVDSSSVAPAESPEAGGVISVDGEQQPLDVIESDESQATDTPETSLDSSLFVVSPDQPAESMPSAEPIPDPTPTTPAPSESEPDEVSTDVSQGAAPAGFVVVPDTETGDITTTSSEQIPEAVTSSEAIFLPPPDLTPPKPKTTFIPGEKPKEPEVKKEKMSEDQMELRAAERMMQENHNMGYAMKYLMEHADMSPTIAAAYVGNFMHEAPGLDPNTHQYGGGPGRGIAQWEVGGRFDHPTEGLLNYANNIAKKPWNTLEAQLGFVVWEITNGGYETQMHQNVLANAGSLESASDAVVTWYERAGAPMLGERQAGTREVAAMFNKYFDQIERENNSGGVRVQSSEEPQVAIQGVVGDEIGIKPVAQTEQLADNENDPLLQKSEYAVDYLRKNTELHPLAVTAIVGNLMYDTQTSVEQSKDTSGFTFRRSALKDRWEAYASKEGYDTNDIDAQMAFIAHDLQNERWAAAKLINDAAQSGSQRSLSEATIAARESFVKPSIKNDDKRIQTAKSLWKSITTA